ncbi:MAG TPA: GAF domain-containing SpoIIE family protein phosphatase [Thermoanaerobaculia bacterium]|nr:GAF domain-containing SpoIIE family protein phosphatase [Thermoanaerobaculia bacterium]
MSETATTSPVDRTARALYALLDLSKALGSEVDLDALLSVIIEKASAVVDAERTSIFVYEAGREVLWTHHGQGITGVIEVPVGSGIAGDVARTRRLTNVADAYADPRFNREADTRSGSRTRSILAAPVLDSAGTLLGVVESINKKSAERFDAEDESLMGAIASHVAVAMERARLTSTYIEHERMGEALKLASEIQMRMLPAGVIDLGDGAPFEIHAYLRPARMVGGDLYDFAVHGNRLYFCLGDVSGKGIGSALVMALTKTLFRANVPYFDDAALLTEAVNVRLCEDTGPTMFVTAFCGYLDLSDGLLRFCNAGHDRPFVLRPDGSAELLQSKPGLALGVLPAFRYPLQEIRLAVGEALFLYTDGVTEATSRSEELFGLDRLHEALDRSEEASALRIIAGVTDAVERFVEGAPQSDDLTMLCVRYRGGDR